MSDRSLRSKLSSFLRARWRAWRWYVIFLFGVWIPVRSVVADYNPVPSGSMIPTILEGDVVFVNKLAYGLRVPLSMRWIARWAEPQRGDIVVTFSPEDGTRLVKRVIAVPGDTVAMERNNLVINGRRLAYAPPREDYREIVPNQVKRWSDFAEEDLEGVAHAVMALPALRSPKSNFPPLVVPPGKVFVLGDNRDNSRDSRYFGFVDRDAIVGRAKGVFVSWDIVDTWLPRMDRFFSGLR
jgi:signal peptidase I